MRINLIYTTQVVVLARDLAMNMERANDYGKSAQSRCCRKLYDGLGVSRTSQTFARRTLAGSSFGMFPGVKVQTRL